MKRRWIVIGSLLAVWGLLLGAYATTVDAAKEDDTLVVAFERTLLTMDFYRSTDRAVIVLAHNWADNLVVRDPETGDFLPHLATSWEWIEPTTLYMTLREGVTFHNGEPFNADAVIATFNYALDPTEPRPGASQISWVQEVEKIDDYTILIRAKEPTPHALETLATSAPIYPPQYLAEVGSEGFSKHPIGTGPYRLVRWDDNEHVFERNEDYFVGSQAKPAIKNLIVRIYPEESSRIAALLAGEAQIARAGSLSLDQLPTLESAPGVRPETVPILRVWFLQMDAPGRSGVDVFTDRRVRQAVNYAIDRQEIIDGLLLGYGEVIHAPCNPLQFGCDPDAAVKYEYNPEKARELLREAGYPNGFTVELWAYRDQLMAQAIQGYLEDVGIQTELRWFAGQYDVASQHFAAGEVPFWFGAWGSYSIFDASASLDVYFGRDGTFTYGTTPEVEELLAFARSTNDPEERKSAYREAIRIITEEAYWVPLFSGSVLAGVSESVDWKPSPDEIERYFYAKWK